MSRSSRLAAGFLVAALASCLYVPSAYGAVIYDEAVSGDLDGNQAAAPNVGALSLGTNTIRGLNSRSTNFVGSGQGDSFVVSTNPLYVITSIGLNVTNYSGQDLFAATIFRPSPFAGYQQLASLSGDGVRNFNIPVQTTNALGFSLQYQSGTSNSPASFDWEWNVEVAEAQTGVPEPSSLSLMAAGLAALTVFGRRRITRS